MSDGRCNYRHAGMNFVDWVLFILLFVSLFGRLTRLDQKLTQIEARLPPANVAP